VLAADYAGYRRLAHLLPVAMPGGAAAIREPWRMALAHLAACESWEEIRRDQGMLDVLLRAARKGINAPMTTSCDRLFDTVAALSGIRPDRITYEGQAAAELEAALYGASMRGVEGYRLALADAGALIFDPRPIWRRSWTTSPPAARLPTSRCASTSAWSRRSPPWSSACASAMGDGALRRWCFPAARSRTRSCFASCARGLRGEARAC
jgi:hypothetical protein